MTRLQTATVNLVLTGTFLCTLTVAGARAESAPALAPVAPEYVCMMNDKLFTEPQIPVKVQGRTYYGCCAMCKERLTNDVGARTAVDPVSDQRVDKATAVIGAAPDGRVFYFENAANMAAFSAKLAATSPPNAAQP